MKFIVWLMNSRKAKAALVAILGILAAGLAGTVTPEAAMHQIVLVVISVIFGVAVEDGATKLAGKSA